MRVVIIGAGVAGSFLGYRLAASGVPVSIFQKDSGREKPCGGGCTPKITNRYPLFPTAEVPNNQIYQIEYESSRRRAVLDLDRPIWIYSRRELDGFLLNQAVGKGAELIDERAVHFEPVSHDQWVVRGDAGSLRRGDFLVGADGATSSVRRRMGLRFRPHDLSATLGYYVPQIERRDSIHIRFVDPELFGYLWSFPRMDHVSLGLITVYKRLSSARMRELLDQYLMDLFGPQDTSLLTGYSAPVPTLTEASLRSLCVSDDNWALVGDAAGFADPITAEGIWYAMRSADVLAECLTSGRPADYRTAWREDFGDELLQAARLRDRFYSGRFLGDTVINRMLQFTERSRTVRQVQNDLIAGGLGYGGVKRTLLTKLPRIGWEVLRSLSS